VGGGVWWGEGEGGFLVVSVEIWFWVGVKGIPIKGEIPPL